MLTLKAKRCRFGIVRTPFQYLTLFFRVQRGTASLRYKNRAEISVPMCEQKPYRYSFRAGAKAIKLSVP